MGVLVTFLACIFGMNCNLCADIFGCAVVAATIKVKDFCAQVL